MYGDGWLEIPNDTDWLEALLSYPVQLNNPTPQQTATPQEVTPQFMLPQGVSSQSILPQMTFPQTASLYNKVVCIIEAMPIKTGKKSQPLIEALLEKASTFNSPLRNNESLVNRLSNFIKSMIGPKASKYTVAYREFILEYLPEDTNSKELLQLNLLVLQKQLVLKYNNSLRRSEENTNADNNEVYVRAKLRYQITIIQVFLQQILPHVEVIHLKKAPTFTPAKNATQTKMVVTAEKNNPLKLKFTLR